LRWAFSISPVRSFVSVGGASMLMTAKGTVSILPVDYLNWSAPLTEIASASHGGELWITGNASPMATSQLSALGWKVVPRAGARRVAAAWGISAARRLELMQPDSPTSAGILGVRSQVALYYSHLSASHWLMSSGGLVNALPCLACVTGCRSEDMPPRAT